MHSYQAPCTCRDARMRHSKLSGSACACADARLALRPHTHRAPLVAPRYLSSLAKLRARHSGPCVDCCTCHVGSPPPRARPPAGAALARGRRPPAYGHESRLLERGDKTCVRFISTFVSVRFVPTNINWMPRETSQHVQLNRRGTFVHVSSPCSLLPVAVAPEAAKGVDGSGDGLGSGLIIS
ncbi:hypothetical protein EVAR_75872_1 [Eumeta japonica]|uniref:Uncharacterized protein n=1 Tax=Eumeta variegata TaxID=151549 RepID=A0A4C1TE25_EUMVA|nr:hypothetical protein EVAR_75872_1 [Eumeta japonica]